MGRRRFHFQLKNLCENKQCSKTHIESKKANNKYSSNAAGAFGKGVRATTFVWPK